MLNYSVYEYFLFLYILYLFFQMAAFYKDNKLYSNKKQVWNSAPPLSSAQLKDLVLEFVSLCIKQWGCNTYLKDLFWNSNTWHKVDAQ